MPFSTKKVSAVAARLVDNSWYTLSCSIYLATLFELESIRQTAPRPCRHPVYRRFLLSRLLFYTLVIFYFTRGLVLAYLLARWGPAAMAIHLYVDPLYSLAVVYFGQGLNAFTVSVCTLFGVFFIAIDYAFSFALDGLLLGILQQIALLNSERFFALNRHLEIPKVRFFAPLDTLTKGRVWLREMWNPQPKGTQLSFVSAQPRVPAHPKLLQASHGFLELNN